MNLFNLPLRLLARQGRWFARGAGIVVAGAVFEFLRRQDQIQLPGMGGAYEVGPFDPYWVGTLAYLVVTGVLKRILRTLVKEAGSHIQRVSRGEWFKP